LHSSSLAKLSAALLLFALVGSACSSTSSPAPDPASTTPVKKTIGASGGTVSSSDSAVTVTVPAGAVNGDVEITIARIAAPVTGAIGQAFEIGPTGTQFNQPVTVMFRYADADLGGKEPSAFAASTVIDGAWRAIAASVIDPAAHTIAGTTTHLSPYAIATVVAAATGTEDAGDAGTPDAPSDAGTDAAETPSCETLNQGKGITEAKAAAATLVSKLNVAAACGSGGACAKHKTPAGMCYGLSVGASTTDVDAAAVALLDKVKAMTAAESECYRSVSSGCDQGSVCTLGWCS